MQETSEYYSVMYLYSVILYYICMHTTLFTQGVGDSPKESQSAKHHSGSRHSTGGTIRVSVHSKGANTSLTSSGLSSQNDYQESTTSSGYSSGSSKPRKTVSGSTEMPLPDGLLDRLKASNWSERYEAVSELEEFVTTYPYSLAPHLHKVSKIPFVIDFKCYTCFVCVHVGV